MKINLFLFSCFFLLPSFFMLAQAEEAVTDKPASEQAETEMSGAERTAYEKSLFEGRCQMCHQLPEPSMLSPKQWKLILGTMQQRMQQAGVPPLTEEETEMILEYIAKQSR